MDGSVAKRKPGLTFIDESSVRRAEPHLIGGRTAAELARIFQALADPTRLRIVAALSHAALCVGDLAALLGMTASAVSHQLRLMRDQRLVRARKDGRIVYYALDDAHIHDLFHRGLEHLEHA